MRFEEDRNCDYENVWGETLHIEYHIKGYYHPATYYEPEEYDGEVTEITVEWQNEGGYTFYMEEYDRDWKRMKKMCPNFIQDIYTAIDENNNLF